MEGTGAPLTLVYVEPENVYNVNFIRDTRDGFCLGDTLTDGMTFFSAQKGSVRYDAPMNTDDGSRRFYAKRKYIRITLSGEDGFSAALEQCLGGAEIPVGCPGGFAAAAEANKRAFSAFSAPFPSAGHTVRLRTFCGAMRRLRRAISAGSRSCAAKRA